MPPRKRMKRVELKDGYRFLTFSCYKRLQLFQTPPLRAVFAAALREALSKPGWRLIAWVIMPEHVHLLARTKGEELGPIVAKIKDDVADVILARWRELDAKVLAQLQYAPSRHNFFQPGGGFDRNVRDEEELCATIRYIHMNPVERGLVASPTEWEHSSARWWCGHDALVECQYPSDDGRWDSWQGYFVDPNNRPRGGPTGLEC